MAQLPDGAPGPPDGSLPEAALAQLGSGPFGVYVHVPFCATRCGYCDFNTYTAVELGGGASQREYAATALAELELADAVLGTKAPQVDSVFFGGGTPTLLSVPDLARILTGIRQRFGLRAGAEVSCEANPDSVTDESLAQLRASGFTRVSFGMQSAVPQVLATLERTHDPDRIGPVVQWARDAGLAVSVDLIYGTPGESLVQWAQTVAAALAVAPDHISAYALVVEPGTALAAQVRRGQLPMPSDDDAAAKYELAQAQFAAAGLSNYEVSNWARSPAHRCQHNLGYWGGGQWWGIGPGAHSHVGGVRWWNVKHPRAYADRLGAGLSPAAGREVLTPAQRHTERVLLELRLAPGLDLTALQEYPPARPTAVAELIADGLLDGRAAVAGRAVLTLRGRLLADTVIRALLPA